MSEFNVKGEIKKAERRIFYLDGCIKFILVTDQAVVDFPCQPCYGNLRPYMTDYPDEVKDEVYKPSDLTQVFPVGKPQYLVITANDGGVLTDFIFSNRSPWKSATSKAEYIKTGGGNRFYRFRDLSFDPTVLVSALMVNRSLARSDVTKEILKTGSVASDEDLPKFIFLWAWSGFDMYSLQKPSYERFFGHQPNQLTAENKTLAERGVYNRPDISTLFQGDDDFNLTREPGWKKLEWKYSTSIKEKAEMVLANWSVMEEGLKR